MRLISNVAFVSALALACSCGGVSSDTPDAVDAPSVDGSGDAPTVACNRSAPFGTPVALPTINSASNEHWAWMTEDLRRIYFSSDAPTGNGAVDIYFASRDSVDANFGTPVPVAGAASTASEGVPVLTADERTLFFSRSNVGESQTDIYVATRDSTAVVFGTPALVLNVNDAIAHDDPTWVSADGTVLYLASYVNSEWNIYRAQRASASDPFGSRQVVAALNAVGYEDWGAVLTSDQLEVYFESVRPGGMGSHDIYVATRSTINDGFSDPVAVAEVNTASSDWATWISGDGCHLLLASNRAGGQGGHDIYIASRPQ